ncbi:MAG TPA: hypothetical protein VD838_00530 [Anaeromyxobacteraceae bacterium]|nr:hypothetical protein [Anaeromyxobacteraceae bacterium]
MEANHPEAVVKATTSATAERLRSHPDTVEVEVCGVRRPWNLGRLALRMAKERGYDADAIISGLSAGTIGDTLERFALLLYAGFLPFEPSLEFDEVADLLSTGDVRRLMPTLTARLAPQVSEAEEVAKGKAAAAGSA